MEFRQRVREVVADANYKELDELFAKLDRKRMGLLEPSDVKPALIRLQVQHRSMMRVVY
jgi:hypothetical protein